MRAVFVDRRCQKEVADQFGYQYSTMRQMVYEFRQALRQGQEPRRRGQYHENGHPQRFAQRRSGNVVGLHHLALGGQLRAGSETTITDILENRAGNRLGDLRSSAPLLLGRGESSRS